MENLLEPDRHDPNGMGGRAGASFACTDRVRDVVLEVCARSVLTIPARREYDMHENAFVARALWERVRLWVGRLRAVTTEEAGGRVRRNIRVESTSVGVTGDHAEARRELLSVCFGATMMIVGAPLSRYVFELASVPVLVVESWSPVIGLVFRDDDSRAIALEGPLVIVVSRKFAAAGYILNMLAM